MKSSIYPIDIETGEIVPGITMLDQEDRDRRKKYWDIQNNKDIRRRNHKPLGSFVMSTCRERQFSDLSTIDTTRLIFLCSYMGYDGLLIKNEHTPMKREDIPKIIGYSKSTTDTFLSNVRQYINENSNGTLQVVDTFFRKKPKGSKERLTKFYVQAVRKLYKETPKSKRANLGRVFQMLEYVNVEFNILCENVYATELSEVSPMTLKQFCAETGYDWSQVSRLKRVFESITFPVNGEEQHFIAFVNTEGRPGECRIVINPHILYGGHNYEKVEVLGLFFK